MIILLLITAGIILLYLLYPLYLLTFPRYVRSAITEKQDTEKLSLVLLSCNGINYLEEKIILLNKALESFSASELIIIDDNSNDGSQELLVSLKEQYPFTLVIKEEQRGIPHSMNMAAKMAQYEILVFCDQRQAFDPGILGDLIVPLQDERTGAVSACISSLDNANHHSFIRRHENFLKDSESRTGFLAGVYGPLYAVRKNCYSEIPENIILDDLYLSLKILATKKIVWVENCKLMDDDFAGLYNFQRSKRYLHGLIQILLHRSLVGDLPFKVRLMLLWHKILRLFIPPLVILTYLSAAFLTLSDRLSAAVFLGITMTFLLSILARRMSFFANINTFFRINIYYFISIFFIPLRWIFPAKK